ncbi:hypothetical protein CJU89_4240 [Yarrowia sp. B02]|nr:hypothetical protein CJU89_4240 [Yarrowia sp. B02]
MPLVSTFTKPMECREAIQDSVDRILGTGSPPPCEQTSKTTLQAEVLKGSAIRMVEKTEEYDKGAVNIEVKIHDSFPDSTDRSEVTQRYHQQKTTARVEPDGQVAKVTIHRTEDSGELTNSQVKKETLSRTHQHHKLQENVADYNEQRDTTEVDLYQKDRGEARRVFSTGFEVVSQERTVWEHSRSRSREGDRVMEKASASQAQQSPSESGCVLIDTIGLSKSQVAEVLHLYGTPERIFQAEDAGKSSQTTWKVVFADDKSASLFLYAVQKDIFRYPGFLQAYHERTLDSDGLSKRGRSRERRRNDFSDGVRSRSRSRSSQEKLTNVERVSWTDGSGSDKVVSETKEFQRVTKY